MFDLVKGKMRYLAFEKSVGGVIFRSYGKHRLYLLLKYRSGQWDFPKGHVEVGEKEEETFRREIKEETGIADLEMLPKSKAVARYFYQARGNEKRERIKEGKGIYIFKKVVYFVAKTETVEVVLDFENRDFVWLPFEKAWRRIGNKDSKRVLEFAEEKISSWQK